MKNLAFLGLEKQADQKPKNLPYGLQRRLELAPSAHGGAETAAPRRAREPASIRTRSRTSWKPSVLSTRRERLSIIIVEHHMGTRHE